MPVPHRRAAAAVLFLSRPVRVAVALPCMVCSYQYMLHIPALHFPSPLQNQPRRQAPSIRQYIQVATEALYMQLAASL